MLGRDEYNGRHAASVELINEKSPDTALVLLARTRRSILRTSGNDLATDCKYDINIVPTPMPLWPE